MKPVPLVRLYRRVLKLHRNFLPADLRLVGDNYVKEEFRKEIDIQYLESFMNGNNLLL